MTGRLLHAHRLLWRQDSWYRRAGWVAPQLVALVLAAWLLGSQTSNSGAPAASAPWGIPAPIPSTQQVDALRDRAKTDQAAFDDLRRQADAGDVNMQFAMATLYDPVFKFSTLVAPDMATAMRYYRMAAEHGQTVAASNLGVVLTTGRDGVARDVPEGLKWFNQAADANYAPAERELGKIYGQGVLVAADRPAALKLFQKAADAGDSYAEAEIGQAYLNGFPPYPKNIDTAMQWYGKAAADPAQVNAARILGIAARDGAGLPRDRQVSLRWFFQAAQKGDTYAAAEIGIAYWNGEPPYAQDTREAVKWLQIAAKSPNEWMAQRTLGLAYRDGNGADRDPAAARSWFGQAARNGDPSAASLLNTVR